MSSLYRRSNTPHSSQMPDFLSVIIPRRFIFAFLSLICIVSAIAWNNPGSILSISFAVMNPISLFFSTNRRF